MLLLEPSSCLKSYTELKWPNKTCAYKNESLTVIMANSAII